MGCYTVEEYPSLIIFQGDASFKHLLDESRAGLCSWGCPELSLHSGDAQHQRDTSPLEIQPEGLERERLNQGNKNNNSSFSLDFSALALALSCCSGSISHLPEPRGTLPAWAGIIFPLPDALPQLPPCVPPSMNPDIPHPSEPWIHLEAEGGLLPCQGKNRF